MKKDCRFCVNWVDENLDDIHAPAEPGSEAHIFFGCKIYGNIEDWKTRAGICPDFQESPDQYALCSSCRIVVPKVCISLGVCINCLNTDLFCVEQCIGGELRKYCTHFVRLQAEGVSLIANNALSDLFPTSNRLAKPTEKSEEEEPLDEIDR